MFSFRIRSYMFTPNLGFVLLFVANPLKSAEFYRDVLGLKSIEESPTFVMFSLSKDIMLGLWSQYTAEPSVKSLPGAMEIGFPVEDVDATYELLGNKGVTIIQKPTDMDFGKTFVFTDLDGHRIRIYTLNENK